MSLGQLLTISCFLTGIVMALFVGGILFMMRYGQAMITGTINRFFDPDKNEKPKQEAAATAPAPQATVASSQSLRRRAQDLDFPAPAATAYGAQAASADYSQGAYPQAQQPARASLRPRDQYPEFNPQAAAPSNPNFQNTMPSLSASRPFNAGNLQAPAPQPPQGQFGQQAANYPQGGLTQQSPTLRPQGNYPQQPPAQYPPQQGQFGQQQANYPQGGLTQQSPSLRPQGNFPQQPPAQRPPQQGQQPINPLGQQAPRHNFPQQPPPLGQFGQQNAAPPQGQQGGLGDYRPPLQSLPRPNTDYTQQGRMRRDNRNLDDFDEGGILGDAGDILDSF